MAVGMPEPQLSARVEANQIFKIFQPLEIGIMLLMYLHRNPGAYFKAIRLKFLDYHIYFLYTHMCLISESLYSVSVPCFFIHAVCYPCHASAVL